MKLSNYCTPGDDVNCVNHMHRYDYRDAWRLDIKAVSLPLNLYSASQWLPPGINCFIASNSIFTLMLSASWYLRWFKEWQHDYIYKNQYNTVAQKVKLFTPLPHEWSRVTLYKISVGSRFPPSQWEAALLSNDVFHWLGTSLESARKMLPYFIAVYDNTHVSAVVFQQNGCPNAIYRY